jgi:hypothetical protein
MQEATSLEAPEQMKRPRATRTRPSSPRPLSGWPVLIRSDPSSEATATIVEKAAMSRATAMSVSLSRRFHSHDAGNHEPPRIHPIAYQ